MKIEKLIAISHRATGKKNIGSIICVGSYSNNVVQELLSYKPQQLILIDPCEKNIAKFPLSIGEDERLRVYHGVLSTTQGEVKCYTHNLSLYNSVLKPSKLKDIFNLETRVAIVPTYSIKKLITDYQINTENNNILMLSPGINFQELLSTEEIKHYFSTILANMPIDNLYEEQCTPQQLETFFTKANFSESYVNAGNGLLQEVIYTNTQQKLESENIALANQMNKQAEEINLANEAQRSLMQEYNFIKDQLADKKQSLVEQVAASNELSKKHSVLQEQQQLYSTECESLKNTVIAITKERDDQTHWHQENKKWAESLINKQTEALNRTNQVQQSLTEEHKVIEDQLADKAQALAKQIADHEQQQAQLSQQDKSIVEFKEKLQQAEDKNTVLADQINEQAEALNLANQAQQSLTAEHKVIEGQLADKDQALAQQIADHEQQQVQLSQQDKSIVEFKEKLQQTEDKNTVQANQINEQAEALNQANQAQQSLTAEHKVVEDQLADKEQALVEQEAALKELSDINSVLQEQQQLNNKDCEILKNRILAIKKERDVQKQKNQKNKKLAASLKNELAEVVAQKHNFEELCQSNQQQVHTLQQSLEVKDQHINSLENDKQELMGRQALLDIEIMKAEAQLELVKDVVLREKSF